MSIVNPSPRPNGAPRFPIIAVIVVVLACIIGLMAIAVLVGIKLFHEQQIAARFAQPAPVSRIYSGSDTPPNTLAPTAEIFKASSQKFDPAVFVSAPLPPVLADPAQMARLAASLPSPEFPNAANRTAASTAPTNRGIIVCDPVSDRTTPPDLSHFGAAAGLWLEVVVAGQPELGRSPLLEDRTRFEQELGQKNFQLTPAVARGLATMTDVACGTVSGNDSAARLTYQMYALPDMTPEGAAVVESGTLEELITDIPKMASILASSMGIRHAEIPTSVGLTATDFSWMGGLPGQTNISAADLQRLNDLSDESPVAALVLLTTWGADDQIVENHAVREMMSKLPDNAVSIGEIGYRYPDELRSYTSVVDPLFVRYPQNVLLAHTEVWQQRVWGSRLPELSATYRTVADSPFDPDSWLTPAETLSNIAEDLRGDKYIPDISQNDLKSLGELYQLAEADRKEAIVIDPKFGRAWKEFGESAMFSGDGPSAVAADAKAESLDPDLASVDVWEMELYQPKWFDDPQKLQRAADRAVLLPYGSPDDALNLAAELNNVHSTLNEDKYSSMASWVIYDAIKTQSKWNESDPNNPISHWNLALLLAANSETSSLRHATYEYRVAAHLLPNSAKLHYQLALVLDRRHKIKDELTELRKAVALDPFFGDAHLQIGNTLKQQLRFRDALPELVVAERLDPGDGDTHFRLGDDYTMLGQFALAAKEYRTAVAIEPYLTEAWVAMASALDQTHEYGKSMDAAEQAIKCDALLQDNNYMAVVNAHDIVADDYLNLKDWSASLDETQKALAIDDTDPTAQENIAEAYWGQGKAEQAKRQWERVSENGDRTWAPIAKKYLAEHFGTSAAKIPATNPGDSRLE
jgi:tetratricopeptide (TPR) repeat protein